MGDTLTVYRSKLALNWEKALSCILLFALRAGVVTVPKLITRFGGLTKFFAQFHQLELPARAVARMLQMPKSIESKLDSEIADHLISVIEADAPKLIERLPIPGILEIDDLIMALSHVEIWKLVFYQGGWVDQPSVGNQAFMRAIIELARQHHLLDDENGNTNFHMIDAISRDGWHQCHDGRMASLALNVLASRQRPEDVADNALADAFWVTFPEREVINAVPLRELRRIFEVWGFRRGWLTHAEVYGEGETPTLAPPKLSKLTPDPDFDLRIVEVAHAPEELQFHTSPPPAPEPSLSTEEATSKMKRVIG